MNDAAGGTWSTFVVIGALTIIPILFMTATSFVKISVVFSVLKNALGAGDVPSGTVVTALAAILSFYVMAPVGARMMAEIESSEIDWNQALSSPTALLETAGTIAEPLRQFLERNANARETSLFLDLAKRSRPEEEREAITASDFMIVLPAFVVTELSEAFQIGFLVFIPFLVVDLVITNVLLALGIQSIPPQNISLPFKLLLFVLVDGWYLLSRALVLGYL